LALKDINAVRKNHTLKIAPFNAFYMHEEKKPMHNAWVLLLMAMK
jgi:hypothetical protein